MEVEFPTFAYLSCFCPKFSLRVQLSHTAGPPCQACMSKKAHDPCSARCESSIDVIHLVLHCGVAWLKESLVEGQGLTI